MAGVRIKRRITMVKAATPSHTGPSKRARKRILIVDDDEYVLSTLVEQLGDAFEAENFDLFTTSSIAETKSFLASEPLIHLILLDVKLPDGDGRGFCRELRAKGFKAPILMLTSSDSEEDTVRGLDAGANDYVAKPFRLQELAARIRAQLRPPVRGRAQVLANDPTPVAGQQQQRELKRLRNGQAKVDGAFRRVEELLAEVRPLGGVDRSNIARDQDDWLPIRSSEKEEILVAIKNMRKELERSKPRRFIFEDGRRSITAISTKFSRWLTKRADLYGDTVARALGLATAAQVVAWAVAAQRAFDGAIAAVSVWLVHWQF